MSSPPERKAIAAGVLSYWLHHAVLIATGFVVSPLLVRGLGAEGYGAWSLIATLAGWLAVLDFGVNAAVVRFVSLHAARGEHAEVRAVHATALALLGVLGAAAALVLALGSGAFAPFFGLAGERAFEARVVLVVVAIDLGFSLASSALLGTLTGLREFARANLLSAAVGIAKCGALVVLLAHGGGLVGVALVQLAANLVKAAGQWALLRSRAPDLGFDRALVRRATFDRIASYGAHGVLIALAARVAASVDSLVVGKLLSLRDVAFYAAPAALTLHLEKLVLAAVGVFVPIASASEAVGAHAENRRLYVAGSRFALLALGPVAVFLFVHGGALLRLWMGAEFATAGEPVLRVLVAAYALTLPQALAQGILRGTSRHRALAWTLCAQAAASLVLGVVLVERFGLVGAAIATAAPLLVANLAIVPMLTCAGLGLGWSEYVGRSHARPIVVLGVLGIAAWIARVEVGSWSALVLVASAIVLAGGALAYALGLDADERERLRAVVARIGRA